MADFNWYLNRQGLRGLTGEKGDQGFSPYFTVEESTANQYRLRVHNENDSFVTENLRGNAIEIRNPDGNYIKYDHTTGDFYVDDADYATADSEGQIILATINDVVLEREPEFGDGDITSGNVAIANENKAVTPAVLVDSLSKLIVNSDGNLSITQNQDNSLTEIKLADEVIHPNLKYAQNNNYLITGDIRYNNPIKVTKGILDDTGRRGCTFELMYDTSHFSRGSQGLILSNSIISFINNTRSDLNSEISNRASADSQLQEAIDAERSERETQDSVLQNQITGLINRFHSKLFAPYGLEIGYNGSSVNSQIIMSSTNTLSIQPPRTGLVEINGVKFKYLEEGSPFYGRYVDGVYTTDYFLRQDTVTAGDNVIIERDGKGIKISATGGGGGGASSFSELSGSPYDNANLAEELNSKQEIISDLDDIRAGAELGSTSIQDTNDCVHLTGNESIQGNKLFNSGSVNSPNLRSMNGLEIGNTSKRDEAGVIFHRNIGDRNYTAKMALDTDGSIIFTRKTGNNASSGTIIDLKMAINPNNGIKVSTNNDDFQEVGDLHDVLIDTVEYSKLNTNAKDIIGAINEIANGGGSGGATIDDENVSTTKVFSSSKTSELIGEVGNDLQDLTQRVNNIESLKVPNVVIVGEPLIQDGQVSGLDQTNHLQFPFILERQGRSWECNLSFTTGDDITTQQNIIDSRCSIALAVRNSRLVIALSSNGTTFNLGEHTLTDLTIQPNTTYYVKISYIENMGYVLEADVAPITYGSPHLSIGHANTPIAATTMLIGSDGNSFSGTVDLNKWSLKVDNELIWLGMDNVGQAVSANVSLSNINREGEQTILNTISNNTIEYRNSQNFAGGIFIYDEHKTRTTSLAEFRIDNIKKGKNGTTNLTDRLYTSVPSTASHFYKDKFKIDFSQGFGFDTWVSAIPSIDDFVAGDGIELTKDEINERITISCPAIGDINSILDAINGEVI